MLTKDQILAASDLPREELQIPEWGGSVFVKSMTGKERDAFESSMVEQRGKSTKTNLKNVRAKLAVLTIVDDQGKRIFSDADADLLGAKSASALNRVFEVAQRLNGLTNEDVEELAKNSESAPDGSSPSA